MFEVGRTNSMYEGEGGGKVGHSHGNFGEAMCLRSVAAQDEEGR